MIDTGSIKFAGDISIEQINIVTSKGVTQNITGQVLGIDIFEDIFSPFMTGVIGVRESYDLINLFPFIGEEYVNIKMYTPSFESDKHIDQQFYIYKIANRVLEGDRTTYYELHFISREAIVDVNKQISKSYSGLVSDIAKDLFKSKEFGLESTKTINVETTSNRTKFISNFWSPVKCLNYIAQAAQTKSGSSNYLIYENRKGMNFNSLEYLYNQQPYVEFVYDNYSREVLKDGRTIFNINEDYKRITEIEVPVLSDYLERASSGMFASKIITSDITTKRYWSKNYDMIEDFNKTTHLNKFAPATNSNVRHPNSMIIKMPKNYAPFNGFADVSNAKSIQRRISQLMSAQTTKINISVPGRTDYTVGMKVYVTLYKVQPISDKESNDEIIDNVLSGYYIVSAINHSINRSKHECTMELIKDSYIMNLNEAK